MLDSIFKFDSIQGLLFFWLRRGGREGWKGVEREGGFGGRGG